MRVSIKPSTIERRPKFTIKEGARLRQVQSENAGGAGMPTEHDDKEGGTCTLETRLFLS